MAERSESQSVEAIVGAVANIVRSSLNRSLPVSSCVASTSNSAPASRSTTFQRASGLQLLSSSLGGSSSSTAPRKRFSPPTLFAGKKRKGDQSSGGRVTQYVRDIVCLPDAFQSSGNINIPRAGRRALLARAGLIGKILFNSDATDEAMRLEICQIFAQPMGLSSDDIQHRRIFPFEYLQRTGAGARSLCSPSVSENFQWNGKQVASLAKSGGFIYILATQSLPGWLAVVPRGDQLSEDEISNQEERTNERPARGLPANEETRELQQDEDHSADVIIIDTPPSVRLPNGTSGVRERMESRDTPQVSRAHTIQPSQDSSGLFSASPSPSTSSYSAPGQQTSVVASPSPSAGTEQIDSDVCHLDKLLDMFTGKHPPNVVITTFRLSGDDFDSSVECLLAGPTLSSILKMVGTKFAELPKKKVEIDPDDAWADVVAHYKSYQLNLNKRIRVVLGSQPPVDTGGVRRQLYSTVFAEFAENKHIRLFDGPVNHRRPVCTAEARASGLFKVLGMMVAHSICQDGIGFPYFSPTCYWYMVGGEDKALQFASVEDVGGDVAAIVSQLNEASTEEHVQQVLSTEGVIDILQRCGITSVLKLSTKDMIAQNVLAHEAVYRLEKLMDQFCDGLHKLGLLRLLRAFPKLFVEMFTYAGSVTVDDVLEAVFVDEEETQMQPGDSITLSLLHEYIRGCDTEALKLFLLHTTGSDIARKKSIRVDFMQDEHGMICAHTCAKLIILPRGAFAEPDSFPSFSMALTAVIGSSVKLSFNTA